MSGYVYPATAARSPIATNNSTSGRPQILQTFTADSAASYLRSYRSPPWGLGATSAASTMATVSDLAHEGAPRFAAVPLARQRAEPRHRTRVMPLEAQAPVPEVGGLDICFVMDCTSSMAPWIEAAKTTVKDMIAALPSDVPNKRVAFVGYRDFTDGPAQVQRFTEDVDAVVRFIDSQVADGGDDIPEDIAGGLAAALGLDWKAETRTVVLVTDAPCHGRKYHNDVDDYPDGDPTGLSMVRLMRAFRLSYIDFTLVQLTSKTDQMQHMLKAIYESAAGPENIRKYELRDLRDIIEEAGGEAAIRSRPDAYSGMLSAAITPTIEASIGSTRSRATMSSMPIRTAMVEGTLPVASASPVHRHVRTR